MGAIHVYDFKASVEVFHPFSHIDQSVAVWFGIVCLKAAAVVLNSYLQLLVYIESNKNMFSSCMFHYVVQCFFNGKINISAKFAGNKSLWKLFGCLNCDSEYRFE